MEEGVVLKIEDNLRGIVGIDRFTSRSLENAATITVNILEEYDIDAVLADVKNAVDRVPSFPVDMEPPIIAKQEKFNRAIFIGIQGDGTPLKTLKTISRRVESDLRGMENISQVVLSGFPEEEIEISVRENDLRAFDLTFQEVARAVANTNILTSGGNIKTDSEEYLIRARNRSYYGDELDYLIVKASPNGQIVRLRDVAEVRDQFSEDPDRLFVNQNKAIQISVSTTNSQDFLSATSQVKEYVGKFNENNSNVQIEIIQDFSIALVDRQNLLIENGAIGILLVLIFLSIFLKPSIALWVAVGLPISFFGLFIFAPTFMTVNIISLFGMILVIGILVDDGIVIGENVFSEFQKGKSPIRAAIDGTAEVIKPIFAGISTTIVAFSLFWFLPGTFGAYFGEISTVVAVILGISLIEAFLILPAHLAHSNALKRDGKTFFINRWADKAIAWLRDNFYAPILRFVLNYKVFGFAIPISIFIITIGAMQGGIIRAAFFPNVASEQVVITLEMPKGTAESLTDSILLKIEEAALIANKDLTEKQTGNLSVIETIVREVGPGSASGKITLNLLSSESRNLRSSDIANAVQDAVGPIYEAESIVYGGGNTFGGKPVSISFAGNNIKELKAAKNELRTAFKNDGRLKDITDNDPAGIKEIKLKLKDNAYLLGLTLNDVMQQVRSGFFGASVQRFQRGRDEIRVWVRYDRKERSSISNLDDMRIVTPTRARVPLSEIANYTIERGEVAINHLNGTREIRIDADVVNIKEDVPVLLAEYRTGKLAEIDAKYPSVTPFFEGQNREFAKVGVAMARFGPFVLLMMFVIIAFTFRSISQPILLFSLIIFSFPGVAWGHYIHDQPLNMLSLLGIIALIGILVNDGLVLIGKFNSLLKEGMPYREALFEAGKARFRAIFLTSLTTVAGLAPLIFEKSFSAQFLIPMAISVAYGIAFATALTLLLLPLLLSVNNGLKVGAKWLWTGKRPTREEVESAVKEMKAEREAMEAV